MKQQVLDLIAAQPNIRTVEISDKLDLDLETVRPLIADEIRSGVIVEEPILAPNGRTVQSFRYASVAPKESAIVVAPMDAPLPARIARTLPVAQLGNNVAQDARIRKMAAAAAAARKAEAAIKPLVLDAAPVDIDVPVARKSDAPLIVEAPAPALAAAPRRGVLSLPERAVAFLWECHPAAVTSRQMNEAMGLHTTHSPYGRLRTPLAKGRVVYENRMWSLGPAELAKVAPAVPGDLAERVAAVLAAELAEEQAAAELDASKVPELAPAQEPAAQVDPQAGDVVPCELVFKSVPAKLTGGLPTLARPGFVPLAKPSKSAPSPFPTLSVLPLSNNGPFWVSSALAMPAVAATELRLDAEPAPAQKARRAKVADKFRVGLLSDGSLQLRIPGRKAFDLEPEDARALYEFVRKHGFAAWAAT